MRRAGKRATLPYVILASGFPPTRLWMTAPAYIPIPRHPEYAGASEDAEHLPNAPDVSEELTGQAFACRGSGFGFATRPSAERSRSAW